MLCRVFKKRVATLRRMAQGALWFDDHVAGGFMPDLVGSSRQLMHHRPTVVEAVYIGNSSTTASWSRSTITSCQPRCLLPAASTVGELQASSCPAYIAQGSYSARFETIPGLASIYGILLILYLTRIWMLLIR